MIATCCPVARAYLLRGAVIWLLARSLISLVIWLANTDPLVLSAREAVIIILVVTVLGFAQIVRLRELVLLGNFGVSRGTLAIWLALPPLAGELIIGLCGALIA